MTADTQSAGEVPVRDNDDQGTFTKSEREWYRWGLEIGLQTALCCKSREEIQRSLDLVKGKGRRPRDGTAEYQSWLVELEMQRWERDERAVNNDAFAALEREEKLAGLKP